MLKVWFCGNSTIPYRGPNLPRQWLCFVVWLLVLPVLVLAFVGSTWLSPMRRPSVSQDDEIAILLQKYGFLTNKTKFGDTLIPTSWAEMHSPLGPDIFKLERAVQILNCSIDLKAPNTSNDMPIPPSANNEGQTNIAGSSYNVFEECPPYFNWIDKDLAPWKESRISRGTLELGKKHAAFTAIILKGTLYIDLYYACFQTRLLYTLWGLLLLLEKYQNKIPDVEFLFNCWDSPKVKINPNLAIPLFSYCSNHEYYDIPWPDWSFWGWSECQMESWDQEFDKIAMGSKRKDWREKDKKAYWRGNPFVGGGRAIFREQLLSCHSTIDNPKVDIVIQDWDKELSIGKRNSKLEDQCTHRYMVYVEGVTWSVSLKYIMACGSTTMVVSPSYYDFFQRGLQPGVHYIQVQPNESCVSKLCQKLNDLVNNAELNPLMGQAIGEAGQAFVQKELSMDKVYDYMYHLLVKYAQLQEFQPSISRSAHLVTQDYILCLAQPLQKLLMKQARKHMSSNVIPCTMSKDITQIFKDYGWETYKPANKKC
ncbi:unnamed protein product [Calypogeia fissa]